MRQGIAAGVAGGIIWLAGAAFAQEEGRPAGVLQLVPGLSLQSDLRYPKGQAPHWNGIGRAIEVAVNVRNPKGGERPDKRGLYLTSVGGAPAFVFEYADGAACVFDIKGLNGALVPGVTTTLALANSRLHTQQPFEKTVVVPGNAIEEAINAQGWKDLVVGAPAELTPGAECGLGMFATGQWGGEISITPNAAGDFTLAGHVDQLGSRGVKQSVVFGPIEARNLTPPRDPRELRLEQTRTASLPDGVLPIMDASTLPRPNYKANSVIINMRSIDDIGFVLASNGDSVDMLASAEWSAPQNFGAATADIGPKLRPGINVVVLGLHNKAFAYGMGKWAYDFSILIDQKEVWRKSDLQRASGVGIRWWKALIVEVKPDDTMDVRALTAEEGERLEPTIEMINANFVQNFGVDRSSSAFAGQLFVGALVSGLTGGGGNGYQGSGPAYAGRGLTDDQVAEELIRRGNEAPPPPPPPPPPTPAYNPFYDCPNAPC